MDSELKEQIAAEPVTGEESGENAVSPEQEQARISEEYKKFGIADPMGERTMDEIADLLSTFTEDGSASAPEGKKKGFAKRRIIISACIGVFAVAALILYFTVVKPIFMPEEVVQTMPVSELLYPSTQEQRDNGTAEVIYAKEYEDTVEIDDDVDTETGEGLGIMMFRNVSQGELQSIAVTNEYGSFTFESDGDGSFTLLEAQGYEYSTEMFAILQASTCSPSIQMRARVNCTEQDYAEFGLAEEQNPVCYTVTTLAGVTHRVYVGNTSPSAGGYYARYDGRDVVYIMTSGMSVALMQDIKAFLTPYLTIPVGTNQYYLQQNLSIYKDGELFMSAKYLGEDERESVTSTRMFVMTYPGNYSLSSTYFDSKCLAVLAALEPTAVLDFGMTPEKLAEWGLDNPPYRITYNYSDENIELLISAKQEDGTYYAYSNFFDMVVSVDGESFAFLDYSLTDFVERPIFTRMITDIRSISIHTDTADYHFTLTHHSDDEDNPLEVTETNSGKAVEDITNFRNLYKDLLSVKIEDLSLYTEATLPADSRQVATVEVRTTGGAVIQFAFWSYPEKDLSYLYTLNGEGEFDVGRGTVEKLLNDADKCMAGETIDPNGRK